MPGTGMYKFHKSHLVIFGLVIYASNLIIKYGLDHTSYFGREIPLFILSVSLFLIVIDHLPKDFKNSDGWPIWVIGMLIPFAIIIIVIMILDNIMNFREERALRYSALTTGKIIGYNIKFDFGELDHSGVDNSGKKSFHVYYKYSVDGVNYKQSNNTYITLDEVNTKNFPYKKGGMVDLEYSYINPIVSRIIEHQYEQ